MSSRALVVRVRLHDPRFHGRPEWPPAPARLFQALVAGASRELEAEATQRAFRWLEALAPPVVAVPGAMKGAEVTLFVPNNDLDAKGGDPDRVPEIRTAKVVQPQLLLSGDPLIYVWEFEGSDEEARRLAELADGLYQFGRGLDMAFAKAEVVSSEDAELEVVSHSGAIFRPSVGARPQRGRTDTVLATPCPGSFESLCRRHSAQEERFGTEGRGKKAHQVFVQPPKARFREVVYDSPPDRFVFELRPVDDPSRFAGFGLATAHELIKAVRDAARERLVAAIGREVEVDAVLIGARPGEKERVPRRLRARLIPLPSIGHEHTDASIRRVVLEVPQGGPLPAGDLRWALSGLSLGNAILVEAADDKMLKQFSRPARRWQSLTAVALPVARRRIDPARQAEEAKGAPEREREEQAVVRAVRQALRHADVRTQAMTVAVSREPTLPQGERAEAFEAPPRFPKARLWHVDIELEHAVAGPLVIGDGRFLGLGVMRPVQESPSIWAWTIDAGLTPGADALEVAAHLRRAVLSRAATEWGARSIPSWVSGHERDGSPAQGHEHLCFVFDEPRGRLVVIDPRGAENGDGSRIGQGRGRLGRALDGLTELRAGRAGLLMLRFARVEGEDPLLRPARVWRTLTPYHVNRHAHGLSAAEAVAEDVRASLAASGLPAPVGVDVANVGGELGVGVRADVRLIFTVAVAGPLMLGRTRHTGGGVFEGQH